MPREVLYKRVLDLIIEQCELRTVTCTRSIKPVGTDYERWSVWRKQKRALWWQPTGMSENKPPISTKAAWTYALISYNVFPRLVPRTTFLKDTFLIVIIKGCIWWNTERGTPYVLECCVVIIFVNKTTSVLSLRDRRVVLGGGKSITAPSFAGAVVCASPPS